MDHLASVIERSTRRRSSSVTRSAAPSPSCSWPAAWAPPGSSSTRRRPKESASPRCHRSESLFPALKNPANSHKAVAFTAEEFHYAFANTLSAEDSSAARQRYAIAAPGNWVWSYGLIANFKPGHQETWVDYDQDRAPLLFIGGEKDHIMPPSVNRSNARHYENSPALTEFYEFEGRDHWTCAAPDGRPSPTTHSNGPRNTRVRLPAPDGDRTQDRAAALDAPAGR